MYSDKPEEKRGIFDRLDMPKAKVESIIKEPLIHITGVRKPVTSIFSRLGGKNESDELTDDQSISFAGILKNAPKKVRICHYFFYKTMILNCFSLTILKPFLFYRQSA